MIFGWTAASESKASAGALCVVRAERVALGALLRSGPSIIDGTHVLRSEDFGQAFHRGIFDTIVRRQSDECRVNAGRVADDLVADLGQSAAREYVYSLREMQCSSV